MVLIQAGRYMQRRKEWEEERAAEARRKALHSNVQSEAVAQLGSALEVVSDVTTSELTILERNFAFLKRQHIAYAQLESEKFWRESGSKRDTRFGKYPDAHDVIEPPSESIFAAITEISGQASAIAEKVSSSCSRALSRAIPYVDALPTARAEIENLQVCVEKVEARHRQLQNLSLRAEVWGRYSCILYEAGYKNKHPFRSDLFEDFTSKDKYLSIAAAFLYEIEQLEDNLDTLFNRDGNSEPLCRADVEESYEFGSLRWIAAPVPNSLPPEYVGAPSGRKVLSEFEADRCSCDMLEFALMKLGFTEAMSDYLESVLNEVHTHVVAVRREAELLIREFAAAIRILIDDDANSDHGELRRSFIERSFPALDRGSSSSERPISFAEV